jgi:hypothetical protein
MGAEMTARANWRYIIDNERCLVIEDVGPWDQRRPTITNDAEAVVAEIAPQLKGRRLLYLDSSGMCAELLVKDGKFVAFAPAPNPEECDD